jgi:hypothetical protein
MRGSGRGEEQFAKRPQAGPALARHLGSQQHRSAIATQLVQMSRPDGKPRERLVKKMRSGRMRE